MGLFTSTINAFYSFGRAIERLSIKTGGGAFKNTGKGLCRECFIESKPDEQLCNDCRLYWLSHIAAPPAFHQRLDVVLGLALVSFGQLMFWLNIRKEWEPPSEPMKALAASIPLPPFSIPHIDIVLELLLALNILCLSVPITIILFILMLRHPSPKPDKRKQSFVIPVLGVQVAMFIFWVCYVGISQLEFIGIVQPQIWGYSLLGGSLVLRMTQRHAIVHEAGEGKEDFGPEKLV